MQFIYFNHSKYIACVVGAKGVGGGGEREGRKERKGKRKGRPSPCSLSNPPPFFPSSLSSTPFADIYRVRYFRRFWKSESDSSQNKFTI